jgi:hypothetical protein
VTVIGREPPADIVIAQPQVSARHASIEHVRDDQYLITDLGSTNGVHVNGRRVQSAFVRPSDRITFGSCVFDLTAWASRIPYAAAQPSAPMYEPAPAVAAPRPAMPAPPGPAAPLPQPAVPAPAFAAPARPSGQPGLGTDLAVALAAQKSFTGKAFLVWFLYWLLWLPGFVMNLVFLSEARGVERLTGQPPPGKGCLVTLLVVHVLLPLFLIILLFVTGGALLNSIFR